ncbi:unnamed protein product [Didymodactylos carnosus]|uniref:Serpin domain-containing protein n=1 Tax=Didymodactylos carnosus TaxID=1234261 RepID=A0A814EXL7_9BILA|nr:unnamed protein product [Didymodactylos carnosus]CAF1297179.1 unnamed protein product [Didymodactylos carnosus]CAF3746479.1 unnamed protein product [Didymodactylos carnosus]CAF4102534.1 unnamed protein product [Didymodactylos carnosus]
MKILISVVLVFTLIYNSSSDQNYQKFAVSLLNLLDPPNSSSIWSPTSIGLALSMCAAGAKVNTLNQLLLALDATTIGQLNTDSKKIINNVIGKLSENQVIVADRLYVQNKYQLYQNYKHDLNTFYNATIVPIDFSKQIAAANTINKWVSQETKNLIKNIILPTDVNSLTRLVLINCLYFKAQWLKPFKKGSTDTKPFQITTTNTVNVQMMHTTSESFSYINATDSIKAQIVEIPFNTTNNNKNLQLVFNVILPNEGVTLAAVQKQLTANILKTLLNSVKGAFIELSLPKFKTESTFDLKKPLQTVNVIDVFNVNKANLTGISPSQPPPLYVTKVIHKAFIDVDENGVTAAAVTAVSISTTAIPTGIIVFNCNRPFLYLIREKTSGLVLFVGTYYGK